MLLGRVFLGKTNDHCKPELQFAIDQSYLTFFMTIMVIAIVGTHNVGNQTVSNDVFG